MPLATNLEELLKHMEPAAAKAQRDFWEANPAIAKAVDEGTVPQPVFSRELNAKDQKIKEAQENERKIREWESRERPKHEKLVADAEKWEAERAELLKKIEAQAQKTELETGAVVNEETLADRVSKRLEGRTVSEAKTREIIAEESKKLASEINGTLEKARKDFLEQTFPQATQFQAALTDVQIDYHAETGNKLDRSEFAKFMQDNNILDPQKAFEQYMAPAREEKRIKAEVDKRVQDELGKRNMPGVTPGQTVPTDLGPLQLKIAGEIPNPDGVLGDRSSANQAAKELREQGAF